MRKLALLCVLTGCVAVGQAQIRKVEMKIDGYLCGR